MLASSCGQYPNVHRRAEVQGRLAGSQGPQSAGAPGTTPGSSPTPVGTEATGGSVIASPTAPPSGDVTTSVPTRSSVPSDKAAPAAAGGAGTNSGSPETWGKTIVIGIHAPITGPGPGGLSSFREEKGLYWRYGNDLRPVRVLGRRVRVVVRNDHDDPSQALDACRRMVVKEHAFLLLGVSGPDQVAPCARYAQSAGVPYLSVGTTHRALEGLGNYFAVSESFAQQAAPLAAYVKKTYARDCVHVLMIAEDRFNVDDAVNAFRRACPGVHVQRIPANDTGASYGSRLCAGPISNYRAVYPLTSAVFFLQMARAAHSCAPRYVGVGITMGLDLVADAFCSEGGRSNELRFLSPAPAFADSQRFDPGFERAAESDGVLPDDIGWLLWGLDQSLRMLLEHAGPDLSRQGFIQKAANARISVSGFGRLQFSPSDHFGGRAFSLLTNVCSGGGGHYETLRANVSGF
jgi:branched-chain amino acid transport system substrate-binding protein